MLTEAEIRAMQERLEAYRKSNAPDHNSWYEAGLRDALAWALGDESEHLWPITVP